MESDEESNRSNSGSGKAPKLTKKTWIIFRDYLLDNYVMDCGEAGEDLASVEAGGRVPEPRVKPRREDFTNDARGDQRYNSSEKQFNVYRRGAGKIISMILTQADSDIKDKIKTSAEFKVLRRNMDHIGFFRLAEQLCVGRGELTIAASILELISCQQRDRTFPSYQRDFTELATKINRFDAEEFRRHLLNAIFVKGVNQSQFPSQISEVLGLAVFPEYRDLMLKLSTFAENTAIHKDLIKTDGDNSIHAFKAGPNIVCWNCDTVGHIWTDCPKPHHVCKNCHRVHLEKFCTLTNSSTKSSRESDTNSKNVNPRLKPTLDSVKRSSSSNPSGKRLQRERLLRKARSLEAKALSVRLAAANAEDDGDDEDGNGACNASGSDEDYSEESDLDDIGARMITVSLKQTSTTNLQHYHGLDFLCYSGL